MTVRDPSPRRHERLERLEAVGAAVVVITVALAPLALGGALPVYAVALASLALFGAAVFVMARTAPASGARREARAVHVPLVAAPFALGAVVTALQLVPLPAAVIRSLSPSLVEDRARAVSLLPGDVVAELGGPWMSLSVDPPDTALALVRLLAALAVVVVCANASETTRASRRIWAALLVGTACVIAVAVVSRLLVDGGPSARALFLPLVNPNHNARVLGALGALLIGRGLTAELSLRGRAAFLGTGAVACTLVPLTWSRGGMATAALALACVLVVVAFERFRRRRRARGRNGDGDGDGDSDGAARIPGGSSGGSAVAVAAGVVPLALGSDTGGSIRQPASMCGVAGIKPTWGRVSRFGLVAFASSLDVIGPLASDLRGAAALLDAIAGHDARDATSSTQAMASLVDACARGRRAGALAGKTFGVPRALLAGEGLRDDVRAALAALEQKAVDAGARVVDIELPNIAHAVAAYYVLCTAEASSNLARFDGVRYGARGAAKNLGELYENTRALFGAEVKRRIVLGSWVLSAGYYDAYVRRAQKVRRLVARDFETALSTCDVVWMPVSPEPAWPLGAKRDDPLAAYLADAFTVPPSLAGLPALSLNAGASREGLPVGVQLVGRAFGEEALVEIGAAVEALAPSPFTTPTSPRGTT